MLMRWCQAREGWLCQAAMYLDDVRGECLLEPSQVCLFWTRPHSARAIIARAMPAARSAEACLARPPRLLLCLLHLLRNANNPAHLRTTLAGFGGRAPPGSRAAESAGDVFGLGAAGDGHLCTTSTLSVFDRFTKSTQSDRQKL